MRYKIFKCQIVTFKLLILAITVTQCTYAQIGLGTTSPHASAKLDVSSTSKGFLPPRLTHAQKTAITSPVAGLSVWCTDCGSNGEMQVYNGYAWTNLVGGTAASPAAFVCGTSTVIFTYNGASVTYGTVSRAYGGSTGTKCWLDRNLGATQVATSSTDVDSYGDLFQWGRGADGHQIRTSSTTSTLSSTNTPGNTNFILSSGDWRSPQNDNLWQGVNGLNNPCPTGFRLPTTAELVAEYSTWSSGGAAGAFSSPLKLPAPGFRHYSSGSLINVGATGDYWGSKVSGTNTEDLWFFTGQTMGTISRGYGCSVRCIRD